MRKIQASLKRKQCQRFNTDAVDYRILVAGLESSGKSSIVSMIVNKEADPDIQPTRGVNASAFTANALSTNPKTVIFHEVGGSTCCRGLMRYYYQCDAVIYVVDSQQSDQWTKHSNPSPDIILEEKQVLHSNRSDISSTATTRVPNGSDSSSTSTLMTSSTFPTTNASNDSLDSPFSPNTPLSPTPSTTTLSLMPPSMESPFSPSDTEDTDPFDSSVRRRSNGILIPNGHALESSNHSNVSNGSNASNGSKSNKATKSTKWGPSRQTTKCTNSATKQSTKSSDKSNSTLGTKFTFSALKSLSLPNVTPKLQRSTSAAAAAASNSSHSAASRTWRSQTAQNAERTPRAQSTRYSANSASTTFKLKSLSDLKQKTSLKPLTMNEAKCNSVQELISKLNYDLNDLDIPFLIFYNKANGDEDPMALEDHS